MRWGGGKRSLTRRAQKDVHQVLIEDEGGRTLGKQVEADGRIHCRREGWPVSSRETLSPSAPPPHPTPGPGTPSI